MPDYQIAYQSYFFHAELFLINLVYSSHLSKHSALAVSNFKPKKLQNILYFSSNWFAKEKSSSIFARTFTKAEWVVS